jgi:hypothetical protein
MRLPIRKYGGPTADGAREVYAGADFIVHHILKREDVVELLAIMGFLRTVDLKIDWSKDRIDVEVKKELRTNGISTLALEVEPPSTYRAWAQRQTEKIWPLSASREILGR